MMQSINKHRNKCKGSLTVESAIIMPVFICVILSFALFIKIVYTQCIIQHAINETANELAVYSYLYSVSGIQKLHDDAKDKLEEKSKLAQEQINDTVEVINVLSNAKEIIGNNKDTDIDTLVSDIKEIKELSNEALEKGKELKEKLETALKNPKDQVISFASLLAQGAFEDLKGALASPIIRFMCKKHIETGQIDADSRLKSLGVVDGLSGLDFSETRILSDKENIDIIVRYKVEPALPINYLPNLYFVQRAKVRAWLDGDGKKPNAVESKPDSTNLWKLDRNERTKKILEQEGKETPQDIAIHKYNDGDVIDVTSINLSDKTYSTKSAVKSRINLSIRKLAEFKHKDYPDIKSRTLIVIIPENSLEKREDVKQLLTGECLEYAKKKNVILKYKEAYGTLPESKVE